MNHQELIELLKKYNRWRRGEEDWSDDGRGPDPNELGLAIDSAANAIESLLAENERLKHNLSTTEQTMREYQELAGKRLEEIERLKTLEESALKVCAELDSIVMVMPYDYLDPPDGGNVPMSEQISRMWSEVKELRAELAKYRDAPVVAWSHLVKGLTFVETYAGSKPLIVKPGE